MFVWRDNAEENKKLEEKCDAEGMGIIFDIQQQGPLNRMHTWRESFQL